MKAFHKTLYGPLSRQIQQGKNFLQMKLKNSQTVGIFRLVMKAGIISVRVQGLMKRIKARGIEVIVYEPKLTQTTFFNSMLKLKLTRSKKNQT